MSAGKKIAIWLFVAFATGYGAGGYIEGVKGIEQGFAAGRESAEYRHEQVNRMLKESGACRWVKLYSAKLSCDDGDRVE